MKLPHAESTNHSRHLLVRLLGVCAMVVTGCLGAPFSARRADAFEGRDPVPFYQPDTVDAAVPTPESLIGHAIGDGAVRYDAVVRYLSVLAEVSPYVTMQEYGQTHEGRPLYYVTVTSEANHANLARIKADNAKLADPRRLPGGSEGADIIKTLPGIAWLAYSIHGDELSSTDAALMVVYRLAAGVDEATVRLRDELVVHIDPLMNPDGRERYLTQLQQLTGKVPNVDYQSLQHSGLWSAGRTNHYLFDLNRDWLMQVHPETRGRSREILAWNPHLLVDSHEMGPLETYLFDPPRAPVNNNLSDTNGKWRLRFSGDQAAALDHYGWSYYTGEWYEEWYPGYTNSWANLLGSVGILYEQAGVDGVGVRQASGELLTYREAVQHHYVSSLANLETLRSQRENILKDFAADRRWAVSGDDGPAKVFLVPPSADRARVERFAELLKLQGVEYSFAKSAFAAQGVADPWGNLTPTRSFPPGTLIVRTAQPRRRLTTALLEFDPRMTDAFLVEEREDLENHRGTRLYDITSWSLSLAYGLEACWADSAADVATDAALPPPQVPAKGSSAYAFAVDGASSDVYRLMVRLLLDDRKVRVGTKAFTAHGRMYAPGTLLLRRHENEADLEDALVGMSRGLAVDVAPIGSALAQGGPDLGGQRFPLLTSPRVAIASQWPTNPTSFGATWHLLDDRLRLPVSPVNIQTLGRGDLRRYNVLIIPDVWSSQALTGVLSEGVLSNVKAWVEGGGTLIAYGQSAAYLAKEASGLSQVRRKRDVLDQHDVYAEAVERERSARNVTVDAGQVWGDDVAGADKEEASPDESTESKSTADAKSAAASTGDEARKRLDEWQRLFSPQGAMMRADLDDTHWLTFGLFAAKAKQPRVPVLVAGSTALQAKYPARVPARLAAPDELRVSGLLWPEARARWGDSAYATVERVGRGQVILFVTDPFFRGFLEGSGRMLQNAVLLGPGLGASQPVPW